KIKTAQVYIQNMIIGIDASRANRIRKTGTEWYSFYLIKNLAKLDQKNKYLLYLDQEPNDDLKEIIKNNNNFSFKVLNWPLNFFWTLGRLSLEMLVCPPKILFIPAHTMPFFAPKKTIVTIHDVAFAREDRLYRSEEAQTEKKWSKKIIKFLVKIFTRGKYQANTVDYLEWSTRFALKKAGKIITVSEFTKKEILEIYSFAKTEKITAIHNGFSENYLPINNPEKINQILAKYGLEKPFLLYVGRLEKKKNTPLLIESFSILKEHYPEIKEKLVLIGNAGFGFDEAKYLVEQFNLTRSVVSTGWIEEEDLPFIFNGATSFIFPTRHEGFGIPVIQAMSCGVPTVASDIPVLREVAGEAVLFFDANDKDALAEAMAKSILDDSLRQELKERGIKRAANFGWEKCAQETLSVIENW
ncbi:MAG: glycosyltransferase family 1 protein, partial [Patescibacteria group bacterium]|nr:glycosyltransferase family 1 protein [Patescibacteria group bacterium]